MPSRPGDASNRLAGCFKLSECRLGGIMSAAEPRGTRPGFPTSWDILVRGGDGRVLVLPFRCGPVPEDCRTRSAIGGCSGLPWIRQPAPSARLPAFHGAPQAKPSVERLVTQAQSPTSAGAPDAPLPKGRVSGSPASS